MQRRDCSASTTINRLRDMFQATAHEDWQIFIFESISDNPPDNFVYLLEKLSAQEPCFFGLLSHNVSYTYEINVTASLEYLWGLFVSIFVRICGINTTYEVFFKVEPFWLVYLNFKLNIKITKNNTTRNQTTIQPDKT